MVGPSAGRAGISADLFAAANAWVGHRRGGLAMSAVARRGGVGGGRGPPVPPPPTTGAGAPPGILTPPSIILIIYAILTEQNVVKLFVAAVVPAMLAVAGYLLAIAVYVRVFAAQGAARGRPQAARRAGGA